MSFKTVPGTAKKMDDIRKLYDKFEIKALEKGRLTGKGREYITYIEDIFEATGKDRIVFTAVVEYIVHNTLDEDELSDDEKMADALKKTNSSLRAFLKSRGSPYEGTLEGRVLFISPKNVD